MRHSQLVVRSSGLLFLVIGLVVATWISRCLFDYGHFDFMVESGQWKGVVAKAVALSIAMMAFGGRVLLDGHRPLRRLPHHQVSMVTPELVYQVRQLVQRGQMHDAIRIYRVSTGLGRRESAEAVRRLTKW